MTHTLIALGVALLASALLARGGRKIGLPTIPLFMAAGIFFGPYTPGIVLVDDPATLGLLASLGLVLLLFHLGLEFKVEDLTSGGPRLLGIGALYLTMNVGLGFAFGLALGWGLPEAAVVAGIVGISSSAIVTKLLVELRRIANPETGLILGIIVVEDLFLAIYLAALQPLLSDRGTAVDAAISFGKALGFLLVLAAVARWGARYVVPLIRTSNDELLTVGFVGLAILVAGVAEEVGVSEAIGAFMIGLILAETSLQPRIENLVLPLRDTFAAIFFFTFGLSVNPGDLVVVAGPIAAAVALTCVVNTTAGVLAGRIAGLDRLGSATVALTILARGEFALILAALAAGAGLDARLAPFAAGYVLILAVAGPLLAAHPGGLARVLPARLFPSPTDPSGSTTDAPVGSPTSPDADVPADALLSADALASTDVPDAGTSTVVRTTGVDPR